MDLFQCTGCNGPFVAEDADLIARRNGFCMECTRRDMLRRFGLPPNFLDGYPGMA